MNVPPYEASAPSFLAPGERILSETSLRHLPLASMAFSNSGTVNFDDVQSSALLRVIRRHFEEDAFCSVCKIIRHRSAYSNREDVAAHFLTSNSVRKGSGEHLSWQSVRKSIAELSPSEPLTLVIPAYSIKTLRHLKVAGGNPDCAEVFGFFNLMRIAKAMEHVLNRECHFVILSDGLRFRTALGHSVTEVATYQRVLQQHLKALDLERWISIVDYETLVRSDLDSPQYALRTARYQEAVDRYRRLMVPIFDSRKIEQSLAKMASLDPDNDVSNQNGEGRFVGLFRSLLFSIKWLDSNTFRPGDAEVERQIFCNPFDTSDKTLGRIRRELLHRTLFATIEYLARIRMDRTGTDPIRSIFPRAIRCTIHPKQGQLGLITLNSRTRIEPWHGSGYLRIVGDRLETGIDFRIALEHSKFVKLDLRVPGGDCCSRLYIEGDPHNVPQTLHNLCECPQH